MALGPTLHGVEPKVPNGTTREALHAALGRQFKAAPMDLSGVIAELVSACDALSPPGCVKTQPPIPTLDWIARFRGAAKKRKWLLAHRNRLPSGAEWADKIRFFIKRETVLRLKEDGKAFLPRIIAMPPDGWSIQVGPTIYSFAEYLKRERWSPFDRIVYASGLDKLQLGFAAREVLKMRFLYKADFSKFDAHQRAEIRRVAFRYLRRCGCTSQFISLLERIIPSFKFPQRWYHSSGLTIETENASMASGEPGTNLLDTVAAVIIHVAALTKASGLSTAEVLADLRMLVTGDDALLGLSYAVDFDKLKQAYESYGFPTDIVLCHGMHDAEFCSGIFLPVKPTEIVIRGQRVVTTLCHSTLPFREIAKFGYSVNAYGIRHRPRKIRRFLRGRALGLVKNTASQIVQGFLRGILRLTADVEGHELDYNPGWDRPLNQVPFEIQPNTVECERYNCSPKTLRRIAEELAAIPALQCVIRVKIETAVDFPTREPLP